MYVLSNGEQTDKFSSQIQDSTYDKQIVKARNVNKQGVTKQQYIYLKIKYIVLLKSTVNF